MDPAGRASMKRFMQISQYLFIKLKEKKNISLEIWRLATCAFPRYLGGNHHDRF